MQTWRIAEGEPMMISDRDVAKQISDLMLDLTDSTRRQ
jgi:hypothetical protein